MYIILLLVVISISISSNSSSTGIGVIYHYHEPFSKYEQFVLGKHVEDYFWQRVKTCNALESICAKQIFDVLLNSWE